MRRLLPTALAVAAFVAVGTAAATTGSPAATLAIEAFVLTCAFLGPLRPGRGGPPPSPPDDPPGPVAPSPPAAPTGVVVGPVP